MCQHDGPGAALAVWSRRAVLVAAALALPAGVVATARPAAAHHRRTAVVYAPHPDDEVLRLTGLVTAARQRGDRLVLVAVTDGGSSAVGRTRHWDAERVRRVRSEEQARAWAALAGGDAAVIRLGHADGAVRAREVRSAARTLDTRYGPWVTHYAACHPGDRHRDHVAVAKGVAGVRPDAVRYGLAPSDVARGAGELHPVADAAAAQEADRAYAPFGHASVPREFAALRAAGYASRVTS